MPSGHASHKGTSDKPNINAEAQVNTAADKATEPGDMLPEGATTNTTRTQEFVDYPPAIQRPTNETEAKDKQE